MWKLLNQFQKMKAPSLMGYHNGLARQIMRMPTLRVMSNIHPTFFHHFSFFPHQNQILLHSIVQPTPPQTQHNTKGLADLISGQSSKPIRRHNYVDRLQQQKRECSYIATSVVSSMYIQLVERQGLLQQSESSWVESVLLELPQVDALVL